jgi:hypothetical protein
VHRSVLLSLLALVLALTGCTVEIVRGSGAEAPVETAVPPAEPSPDTVVNAAPAGDVGETRAEDEAVAVRITDAFWRNWFSEQGVRYVPPRVAGGYTGRNGPSCGGQPSVPGNAYYCPRGNFIAWDDNLMRAGYTQIGDAWVYLVIAHEWGHAIQAQLPERLVPRQIELQADCLAGASLQGAQELELVRIEPGDDQEIARTLEAVADDFPWTDERSHGNAQERTAAFQSGVSGGVERCIGQ